MIVFYLLGFHGDGRKKEEKKDESFYFKEKFLKTILFPSDKIMIEHRISHDRRGYMDSINRSTPKQNLAKK